MRRLHQVLEKAEHLERHREDEDLVALTGPEVEEVAEDLREGVGGQYGLKGDEEGGRREHLPLSTQVGIEESRRARLALLPVVRESRANPLKVLLKLLGLLLFLLAVCRGDSLAERGKEREGRDELG